MIDWPSDLVDDLARRRSVIFLGAGVSKNATNSKSERPKDWGEFLRSIAEQVTDTAVKNEVNDSLESGDLLTACELAKRSVRDDVFKSHLLAEYSDKRFGYSAVHDDIIELDSRFVLTTNFDKIYENRANQVQQNTVLVRSYDDAGAADILRRNQRYVLKVHGTIDVPDRTIFTRSEYARARTEHSQFYRMLEALFLTQTFVFLGASMRDPDIQMLLENYAYQFPGARPHYVISPDGAVGPSTLAVMEESMNLRIIRYSPENNHRELADSLKVLAEAVNSARATLRNTVDW